MEGYRYHVAVGDRCYTSTKFADAMREYSKLLRIFLHTRPATCCPTRNRAVGHITVKMGNTVLVVLGRTDIMWLATMCAVDDEEDLSVRRYHEDMVLQMVGDMYAQRLEDPREKLFHGVSTKMH